jgi:hypothetical protein
MCASTCLQSLLSWLPSHPEVGYAVCCGVQSVAPLRLYSQQLLMHCLLHPGVGCDVLIEGCATPHLYVSDSAASTLRR